MPATPDSRTFWYSVISRVPKCHLFLWMFLFFFNSKVVHLEKNTQHTIHLKLQSWSFKFWFVKPIMVVMKAVFWMICLAIRYTKSWPQPARHKEKYQKIFYFLLYVKNKWTYFKFPKCKLMLISDTIYLGLKSCQSTGHRDYVLT